MSKQEEMCSSPMTWEPLSVEEAATLARMFKALGDPIRLRLFSLIASHEGGEACVCELTDGGFAVTGPTISHHLRVYVCVHNAGRSQMAAALLHRHAQSRVHVRSAPSADRHR